MGDTEDVTDPTETDGLPGGEEEESLQDVPAPEDESEGEGETEDETDTEEEDEEAPPAKGSGGAYDKLLAKYGGDQEALANAYFEQANSTAQIARRLQAMEDYIKGQSAPKIDEQQLLADDPDVKELAEEKQSIQSTINAASAEQNRHINEYGRLEKLVATLSGKLEALDPETQTAQYQKVQNQLAQAATDQRMAYQQFQDSKRVIDSNNMELRRLDRRMREAVGRVKEKVDKLRVQQLEQQQDAIATRQEFAEAMQGEAERYGIPVESKQYAVLFTSIKDRIYAYLSRLAQEHPEAPGVDLSGAVATLMGEYADTMGLKPKTKFQKASKTKRAGTTLPAPKISPEARKAAVAGLPKDPSKWTAKDWLKRAERLLP
jgi:hypothetical protein